MIQPEESDHAPFALLAGEPVDLGPVTDDNLRIIRSGVTAEDEIIINGLLRARPGGKVKPEQGKIEGSLPPPATNNP